MTTTVKSNDPCWCGSGRKFKRCHKASQDTVRAGRLSPRRTVPDGIVRPDYAHGAEPRRWDEPRVKSPEIIAKMRVAGQMAAEVLHHTGSFVAPGVTTDALDQACHEEIVRRGAYPSPLGYRGYPKSLCTSVNEVICHGIPDDRPLADGDIVNLDVTVFVDGVHGDTNATFLVGEVDPDSGRLVTVTHECLERAIAEVRPGRPFNVIGRAIEDHAGANGYGVVRSFVGHGIGEQFHTDLQIPHYFNADFTTLIEEGMTFTIEPMITMGDWRAKMWSDGWTAVTADLRRTAQFEHTLLVSADGAEVLTAPPT
ncbi:MAG: type I methionyl aminopeptidase [Acidimicrobiales bacterium]